MPTKIIRRRKQAGPTQTLERIDPDEDFSDVSGDPGVGFEVLNGDPTRKYAWAHHTREGVADFIGGVVPYEMEYVSDADDAVKLKSGMYGLKVGEPLTSRDMVLMSCDRAKWEKRQRYERNSRAILNSKLAAARQRDTTAGEHAGEWDGLGR